MTTITMAITTTIMTTIMTRGIATATNPSNRAHPRHTRGCALVFTGVYGRSAGVTLERT